MKVCLAAKFRCLRRRNNPSTTSWSPSLYTREATETVNIYGIRVGAENIHALRDDIQCFALMICAFGDDMHGFAVICALRNVGEGLAPPEQTSNYHNPHLLTSLDVGSSTEGFAFSTRLAALRRKLATGNFSFSADPHGFDPLKIKRKIRSSIFRHYSLFFGGPEGDRPSASPRKNLR